MNDKIDCGSPIIFFPGWGIDCNIFSKISKNFKNAKLLNYFDFVDLSMEKLSTSFLESIPDQSIIIAWSFGGSLAIDFCNRYPEKCQKLILISSTPKFLEDKNWHGLKNTESNDLIKRSKDNLDDLLQDFMRWTCFPSTDKTHRTLLKENLLSQDSLSAYLSFFLKSDLRESYKKIKQPILHIVGSEDAIIKKAVDDHLRILNERIKISTIKGAGHMPFITHEEEFLNHINEFIA